MKIRGQSTNHFPKIDQFSRMGDSGPVFRALLAGVAYPVKNENDLIKKVGGESRIIQLPNASGSMNKLYCVKDVLEAVPKLDQFYPFSSEKELIDCLMQVEKEFTKASTLPRLHGRVKNTHLKAALNKKRLLAEKTREEYKPYPSNLCCTVDVPAWMYSSVSFFDTAVLPPPAPCAYRNAWAKSDEFRRVAETHFDKCIEIDGEIDLLIDEYRRDRTIDVADQVEFHANNLTFRAEETVKNARDALISADLAHQFATYVYQHQDEYLSVYFPSASEPGQCEASGPVTEDVISGEYEKEEGVNVEVFATLVDEGYDQSYLWAVPRRMLERAPIIAENAFRKLDMLRMISTIERSTICGVLVMENGEALEPSSLKCRIWNESARFYIRLRDEEGNVQRLEYDFSDEQHFDVDANGAFSVTGYYGTVNDSWTIIEFEIVRTSSYYHDPTPNDRYSGEWITESFTTNYENWITSVNPQCFEPIEIN